MELKPIRNKRMTEGILEQVKDLIAQGGLTPGERFYTEAELVESFQVSRSAVREALAALSLNGILDIKQGGGIFVKDPDANSVIEPLTYILLMEKDRSQNILEVRKALEVEAAGLAAARATQEDIERLEILVEGMKAITDPEKSLNLDFEFHFIIAEASKNPLLDRLMRTIQETIRQIQNAARISWLSTDPDRIDCLIDEHCTIYQAIRKQDVNLARERMYQHLFRVEVELAKLAARGKTADG